MVAKLVTDLHVRCSFAMVPNAIAVSDTCQHPAVNAVVDPNGNRWYRCQEHEGWLNNDLDGPIVEEVEYNDEC